jgi:hypothetical protein
MPSDDDSFVPEITAANPDGGAADLNADPIDQSTSEQIDSLLDQADSPEAGDIAQDKYSRNTGTQRQQQQTESELDPEIAAIAMPSNMSPQQQSNWRKLAASASAAKREAAEAQMLRERLEQQYQQQNQQLPPDYEELKKFRATFDIRNDPSFRDRYEKPIKEATESIYSLLKKHRASDDVIESIKQAGGPGKVSKAWWKKNAIDRLYETEDGFVDAKRLENALLKIEDTEIAKEQDLEHATQHQEEWMQAREQERMQEYQQESVKVRDYVENITQNVPWARYKDIPPGATAEQARKIEAHNAGVRDLETKFNSALYPRTANDRAAVASAAVLSHVVTERLRTEQGMRSRLEQQVAQLTKELNAIKAGGRMPKSNVSSPSKPSGRDRINMSASDAIDLGLEEAGA